MTGSTPPKSTPGKDTVDTYSRSSVIFLPPGKCCARSLTFTFFPFPADCSREGPTTFKATEGGALTARATDLHCCLHPKSRLSITWLCYSTANGDPDSPLELATKRRSANLLFAYCRVFVPIERRHLTIASNRIILCLSRQWACFSLSSPFNSAKLALPLSRYIPALVIFYSTSRKHSFTLGSDFNLTSSRLWRTTDQDGFYSPANYFFPPQPDTNRNTPPTRRSDVRRWVRS